MNASTGIAEGIRGRAIELGFSACGFARPERLDGLRKYYRQWLEDGRHGRLGYLERNWELRLDPAALFPGTRTIISLAASYYHPDGEPGQAGNLICRYARGKDYHMVLKRKADQLLAWIREAYGPVSGKVCVDSASILEKEWARRAGLGWIGKHGLLIVPGKGSWMLLCEILTDLEVNEPEETVPDQCGSCTLCMKACPTQAIRDPWCLEPRNCIAYLTIENRAEIPENVRGKWSHTVYGCDLCQEACPWNREPEATRMPEFIPDPGRMKLTAQAVAAMTEAEFRSEYGDTPLVRAGLPGLLRNFTLIRDT